MNERIQKLKHQASLWCDRNIPEQYSEETNSYGSAWEDKFAELLIRECARLAMTQHISTSPDDYHDMEPYEQGCDDTASTISGLIQQHFGVK